MHCTQCGVELVPDAKFCSGCGFALGGPQPAPPVVRTRDWDLHVSVLGWLIIAHAAVTGLLGLAVMFGGQVAQQFVTNNPRVLDNADPDIPLEAFTLIGPITFLVGVLLLIISMPSIAAGIGLLRYRNWGRVLTLVLSVLRLLEFPLGTATAIYSFWVLLSRGGKSFFSERAARAEI
ncbi:MAG TPA: zinc-ribbon domain-containing protein [Terriglobia bacterium]|nr:zinc-ribbon domain-containing protein [Terriglobia bacterium]